MIPAVDIIALAGAVLLGVLAINRPTLRDPRLDRTWSDDEPAPDDAPAILKLDESPSRYGSENAGAYQRMLDDDRPQDD